jgi:hypothetical protein
MTVTQPPPGYSDRNTAGAPPGYPPPGFRSPTKSNSLGLLLALAVALLGVLSIVWGFLPSSELRSTTGTGTPLPLGSVFAVVGWVPALLLLSGLTAAATLLPGVSKATGWAVSAAAAISGGLGALFYFFARPGTDAGIGFTVGDTANARATVEDNASIGLILLLIFGLLQLLVAVTGAAIVLLGRSRTAPRGPRAARPRPGPGPGPGPQYGYGPPPGSPQQRPPGRRPEYPPAYPPPYPPPGNGPGQRFDPQGRPIYDPAGQNQVPTDAFQPAYDPQAGREVYSGGPGPARPTPPGANAPRTQPPAARPQAPPPMPAQVAAGAGLSASLPAGPDNAPGPAEAAPPQYARTEYGSADYEWEPTYSEAPRYEAQAEHESDAPPAPPARPEQAFLYETPEWERPQFEPPHFDSGRHPGWDAGFVEEATADQPEPGEPTPGNGPGWRSIPRAE